MYWRALFEHIREELFGLCAVAIAVSILGARAAASLQPREKFKENFKLYSDDQEEGEVA